jgi:hypothetical protein
VLEGVSCRRSLEPGDEEVDGPERGGSVRQARRLAAAELVVEEDGGIKMKTSQCKFLVGPTI